MVCVRMSRFHWRCDVRYAMMRTCVKLEFMRPLSWIHDVNQDNFRSSFICFVFRFSNRLFKCSMQSKVHVAPFVFESKSISTLLLWMQDAAVCSKHSKIEMKRNVARNVNTKWLLVFILWFGFHRQLSIRLPNKNQRNWMLMTNRIGNRFPLI